jgi:transcriptional regulator with XRE-family HTH domain
VAKGTSIRAERAAVQLGEHFATWRKLLNLTADQVAQRADVGRGTLRRLENGESVGLDVVLAVARALGVMDRLVDAVDPWESDIGRARAGSVLPKRVRRHD